MDGEAYRIKIEKEIIEIIKERLTQRKMDAGRASELAKYIISTLHSHMSIEQIHTVVKDFDKHFPELTPVVLEVARDNDQQSKDAVIKHVEHLLKEIK